MTVQHYKITAPEALFSGVVAGVAFHNGIATLAIDPDAPRPEGETRTPQPLTALAYFRRKGYLVEEVDQKEAAEAVREAITTTPGTPNTRAVDPGQVAGSGLPATPAPAAPAAPAGAASGDEQADGNKDDDGKKTAGRRSGSTTSKEAGK